MAVVVLTSPGHAPGVTTTALGLGISWPRDVIVADCDRHPSQSVLAGYLHGVDPGQRGLGRLLQAHRERRPLEPLIQADCMRVGAEDGCRRGFLPGFPHPGAVSLFEGAWAELMAAFETAPADVLVDAGAIGPGGLPGPLTSGADLVLVVVRTTLVALAALRLYLPGLVEAAGEARTGLLLIGEGQPYGRSEIETQFGVPVWGVIASDPRAAAVFSDGAPTPRRFLESAYLRSLDQTAAQLLARFGSTHRPLVVAP